MCTMATKTLRCPECNSENVVLMASQWWSANTGELFCHYTKTHDLGTNAKCITCDWEGRRYQLIESTP